MPMKKKSMMTKFLVPFAPTVALLLIATIPTGRADDSDTGGDGGRVANRILAHHMDIEAGRVVRLKYEQPLSGGLMNAAKEFVWEMQRPDAGDAFQDPAPDNNTDTSSASAADPPSRRRTQGCQNVFVGDDVLNIRVNQDCSQRRQAEEAIAVNPTAPHNLIVGYNDSRIGFNHGAYAWSFDSGKTWGDQVAPFFGFVMRDGHTADAFSDPTATFDSDGNAYIGGVFFDVNFAASAVLVAKSNAGIGGAFYHSPVPGPFQTYSVTPLGVVANDNSPNVAHDKPLMIADANPTSPKKNNAYMTWTRFANTSFGVRVHSPIYFSQSTNGGRTWSAGIEISGANAAICTVSQGEATPGACDQDQGSDPIVGPDGTIYVSFNNLNTPTIVNQQLIVKCPASSDCSLAASWAAPVKIADDVSSQPFNAGINDPAGCPVGRQCLPPNGYRMNDYGALSVDNSGRLYFVWSDFRNGGGTCSFGPLPQTSPCDNDVFYTFSTNGGATWSVPFNVTPASKFGPTAQWQAWGAAAPDGSTLWVGYYDRHYGNCETTGCNDITLAQIRHPATASPTASYRRVTTSSMPNLIPPNPQNGFLGDYMWVAADAKGRPHVVWADTRGLKGIVEEDVYYAKFGDGDDDDHDQDHHDHD
jgi:hypothetical protein